jgi:hypothetical protein
MIQPADQRKEQSSQGAYVNHGGKLRFTCAMNRRIQGPNSTPLLSNARLLVVWGGTTGWLGLWDAFALEFACGGGAAVGTVAS